MLITVTYSLTTHLIFPLPINAVCLKNNKIHVQNTNKKNKKKYPHKIALTFISY